MPKTTPGPPISLAQTWADQADLEGLFQRIGLEQHLSPNRRNGFFSMVEELTRCAVVARSK